MKYKIILLLLISIYSVVTIKAQVFERSRKEIKNYKVYEQTSLEIVNKYGNIHLFNWNNDSVRIEIDIQVKASKQQKADKLFEFIDFEFTDSKYYIVVKTQLRQNQGSLWTELSDLANTVFSGNNKIQVDYNVYLPSDMEVSLENKFGNIYCTNHRGKLSVDLSNGDFKANDLSGESDIAVGFGNASIQSIERGFIKLAYAELSLASAESLKLESKSSEIDIASVDMLILQSRRDQITLGELVGLSGETNFSYLTIQRFHQRLTMQSEYGDLKIKQIPMDFQKIDLNARYTDISLTLDMPVSCQVNIEHSESTGIYYPDHFEGLQLEPIDKKANRYRTAGIIGNSDRISGLVNITIQSGKVSLQELSSDLR
ncbi:MAG: hypothetical protein KQI35_00185 [Bacteroidetes bacterium]|nr:hypothetical protein [Bacteroidota bacterium]